MIFLYETSRESDSRINHKEPDRIPIDLGLPS